VSRVQDEFGTPPKQQHEISIVNGQLHLLLSAASLAALMLFASWRDLRTRRIPNKLILAGLVVGLSLQYLIPRGSGLFSQDPGGLGLVEGCAGTAIGLLMLLPAYAMGAMGAGDVKLMAMVGAFLGPYGVVGAALLSMLAGGVLAVVSAVWSGTLIKVLGNVRQMLMHAGFSALRGDVIRIEDLPVTTGKLAYAVAITIGTALQLILAQSQAWSFFSA
jgi:prepilin peptidase CpaA